MAVSDDVLTFQEDKKARLTLLEQLDVLTLPPAKQRRLVKRMALDVRTKARRNIRQQKTITGSPMEDRANKRRKRKMLIGLGKKMVAFNQGNQKAAVSWKDGKTAAIAASHQHGKTTQITASRHQKAMGKPDYKQDATREQARALISEGYRQPVKGKNGRTRLRRVSQKWIRNNLTIGQAGLILKELRDQQPKQAWSVRTPARPFLGATPDDTEEMLNQLAKQALAGLKAKGAR